jgi:hypothetical protein
MHARNCALTGPRTRLMLTGAASKWRSWCGSSLAAGPSTQTGAHARWGAVRRVRQHARALGAAAECWPGRTACACCLARPAVCFLHRTVLDLPVELKDGKATALRVTLPPHFPQVSVCVVFLC